MSRWAADGMQISPRKAPWTSLLLTLGADGRWALSTPHCFHRVYFRDIKKGNILSLDNHSSWGTGKQLDVSACLPGCKSREKYICIHPIFSYIAVHSRCQVFNSTKACGNGAYAQMGQKSLLLCCLMELCVAFTIPIIKPSLGVHSSISFLSTMVNKKVKDCKKSQGPNVFMPHKLHNHVFHIA